MGILRDMFGPSRDEIWGQFAAGVQGNFIKGGFWRGSKVEAWHGQWRVLLDTYTDGDGENSTIYTRIRAPYVNPDGFRFTIYRKSMFSGLGKLLGMQDVVAGHAQFDEDFIIQGNDEAKLKQFFDNATIRQLITNQPRIHFRVKDDEGGWWASQQFPRDVDELYFRSVGVIRDLNRLKQLYDLFAETLDELCRMGSAYQQDPGIRI